MNRVIAYSRNNSPHDFRQFVDEVKTFEIDLTKLEAELSDTIATCTWSVVSGNASIANEALASSVATAEITTSKSGNALIKVLCAGANNTHAVYFSVKVIDPRGQTKDY